MKTYEEYKDSGVEWIGEIPEGWGQRRISTLGTFRKGRGIKKDEVKDSGFPCIRYGEIYTTYERVVTEPVSFIDEETTHSSETVEKGDFLFTGSGETVDEIGKTIVYYGDTPIYVGGDIIVFTLYEDDYPLFFSYLFNSDPIQHQKSSVGRGGIIVHIYPKQLRDIVLPIPPLPEQQQIVTYLDQKTSQIDELIDQKTRKIELLKEYRTSLINQVVTKGLDQNVEMKASGVEWVGKIPVGWETRLLKFVFSPREAKSRTGDEELLSVRIQIGVIKRRDYLDDDGRHLSRSESLIGYKVCSPGNLVNNIMKMGFYCLGISGYEGIVSPAYSVFELQDSNDNPRYWEYLLKTEIYVSEYRKKSKGIQESRMRLYDDYFLSIHSIYPPSNEQQQIVTYLDQKTQEIDESIEIEEKKIEHLIEYRQSLISNVVTGKNDVRDTVLPN
jgi:type I restriction enzyme, S subunit